MPTPPPIDPRSVTDLVAQTEGLAQRYSDWQRVLPTSAVLVGRVLAEDVRNPATAAVLAARGTLVDDATAQLISTTAGLSRIAVVPVPDAGSGLVRISARMLELLVQRLNQVPRKNFLAFLDLLGLSLLPPQAARVPLTFHLAAGSTDDALVPAHTAVGAALAEGESTQVLYWTERELVVTRSQLVAVHAREPLRDLVGDHTAVAAPASTATFAAFEGDRPIGHRLYLGHGRLGGAIPKTVTLRIAPADGVPWLSAVSWSRWDGAAWQDVPATVTSGGAQSDWVVTLPDVPGIPASAVAGRVAPWLRADLATPLPHAGLVDVDQQAARTDLTQSALPPDACFSDDVPLALDQPLYPFGRTVPRSAFLLASDVAFGKPGARVEMAVAVDEEQPARPSSDLVLGWEYWDGQRWAELGRSSPSSESVTSSPFGFADTTHAFGRDGVVRFTCPSTWQLAAVAGVAHRWLRVRPTTGGFGSPSRYRPPELLGIALGYTWPLPRIATARTSVAVVRSALRPEAAFTSGVPADAAGRFFPFGQAPAYGAELLLAHDEAFGAAGALVTLDIAVANPAQPQARWPIPPVRASADLAVAWEYWNGRDWVELGRGVRLPGESLLEPYASPSDAADLVLTGRRPAGAQILVEELHTGALQATDGNQGPNWLTRFANLPVGAHAFRLTALIGGSVAGDRRWTFAFRTAAGTTAPELLMGPAPGVTSQATVTMSGRLGMLIPNAKVLVHNAATDATASADVGDTFQVGIGVREGRNDLLVLVTDAVGQTVAGAVVPVVRRSATPPTEFADSTWAFTRTGQVTWRVPADVARREVGGTPRMVVRARIDAGDYGMAAAYGPVTKPDGSPVLDPLTGAPVYQLNPATFRPPSAGPVSLAYRLISPFDQLEQVVCENDDRFADRGAGDAPFLPFTPTTDRDPTLYLGFRRPGADTGFANRSTTLYFGVAEVRYGAAREGGAATGVAGGADGPPNVVWEYWNGQRWANLGVRDETAAFTRRGLVTFVGPDDFRGSTEFGETAFWLRARWERGRYASPPRLYRVLTNTTWAGQSRTVQGEVLGSSNGEPAQVFRTAAAPVLPGERIEVREPEMPSTEERAAIEAEEGRDAVTTVLDAGGRPAEVWVRWHGVVDFSQSTARSRHYVLDRGLGEVRFGDGRHGLTPPRGRANVRAASYATGGGQQGNRPASSVSQLKTALPGVDAVTNWEPARGGSPPETLEALEDRGPRTLRHGDRAVAISDFEDLALQASTDVARARGLSASVAAEGGGVTVVVVPRDPGPQPIPDLELLGRVSDYLGERLSPTVDVQVEGPSWARVTVTAEVVPVVLDLATEVQVVVLARLAEFLHPLTGGPDGRGWDFGRQPHRSELYALIESVSGVDHVRTLRVAEDADDGAELERRLVYSGEHVITMVREPGGRDGTVAP